MLNELHAAQLKLTCEVAQGNYGMMDVVNVRHGNRRDVIKTSFELGLGIFGISFNAGPTGSRTEHQEKICKLSDKKKKNTI